MTNANIHKPLEYLDRVIGQMQQLSAQCGDLDDMKVERERAKAQLDEAKRELKMMQGEVKEATHWRDKYLAEAREKLAESERLDKELAAKRAELSVVNDHINKIRQQLGG